MKKIFKFLGWLLLVLVVLIILFLGFVQLTWDKDFDAPLPDLKASTDSLLIERGRYLVYGPSHCAACHIPMEKIMEVDQGLQIPLSGGWQEDIPGFGSFRAPNLTPDPETGIGNISDGQLARAIRYKVGYDGKIMAPFMTYQAMADEDVIAILSFLRSQPAVHNQVEKTEWGIIGKILIAFGMLKPEGPKTPPPAALMPEESIAYGKYLADHVSACLACHIHMDETGNQIGEDYIGGSVFPPNPFSEGMSFVSPNLTPDPETGIIAPWSVEAFVARFQQGRIHKGSPMPWGFYQRMEERDIRAIYAYLHSLQPIRHEVPKTFYQAGEEIPAQ